MYNSHAKQCKYELFSHHDATELLFAHNTEDADTISGTAEVLLATVVVKVLVLRTTTTSPLVGLGQGSIAFEFPPIGERVRNIVVSKISSIVDVTVLARADRGGGSSASVKTEGVATMTAVEKMSSVIWEKLASTLTATLASRD